jgi:hypothetical protein
MWSLEKTKSVRFDWAIDAAALPEHLASRLRGVRAEAVRVSGNRVTFRAGIFRIVSNWNLLVPFGSGDFAVDSENYEIRYTLSCRQLVLGVTLILAMGAICVLATAGPKTVQVLLLFPLMWCLMVFGNLGVGFARFENFVNRALASAPRKRS